jgi:hypothetical protein
MKYLILSVLFLFGAGTIFQAQAQEEKLSAFDYVVVPERFDFQYERDQYQFNSLLKFLFNKHGFHAYFPDELPDVSRCDGLYADIEQISGFVWTELNIRLVDCDGILFYQTKTGRSKLKDYAKAYSEALRMAFESIEILGVRQGELEILQKATADAGETPTNTVTRGEAPVKKDRPLGLQAAQDEENKVILNTDPAVRMGLIPDVSMMSFTANEASFLLRRTNLGYQWYREDDQDLIYEGKFFIVEKMLFFEDKDQMRYQAEFTSENNLILNREGQKLVFVSVP